MNLSAIINVFWVSVQNVLYDGLPARWQGVRDGGWASGTGGVLTGFSWRRALRERGGPVADEEVVRPAERGVPRSDRPLGVLYLGAATQGLVMRKDLDLGRCFGVRSASVLWGYPENYGVTEGNAAYEDFCDGRRRISLQPDPHHRRSTIRRVTTMRYQKRRCGPRRYALNLLRRIDVDAGSLCFVLVPCAFAVFLSMLSLGAE